MNIWGMYSTTVWHVEYSLPQVFIEGLMNNLIKNYLQFSSIFLERTWQLVYFQWNSVHVCMRTVSRTTVT